LGTHACLFIDVGKPKPGDTVVVSGAAGATGSLVVQLAKIHGCRVIGIAGGPEKCRRVREEFGADVALDYRSPDFEQAFIDATPDFVNVYFDNVGGKMLDLVLTRLATYARIALCGAISEYNTDKPVGIFNYFQLVLQKATMQGFIVLDYMHRFQECAEKLLGWYMEGKIRVRVDVRQGIESAPHALTLLFTGENQGKLLVQTGEAKL
jgi:NADPH-dependent curcumin reductase CurA